MWFNSLILLHRRNKRYFYFNGMERKDEIDLNGKLDELLCVLVSSLVFCFMNESCHVEVNFDQTISFYSFHYIRF